MSTHCFPDVCTLPTAERPLREAEFGSLFAEHLRAQQRVSPTALRWLLSPAAEAVARDLTARETECCSFFTFTFTPGSENLRVDVEVPPARAGVLNALETLATQRFRA